MNTFYHGSPCLFGAFALTNVGDGTGIKFGLDFCNLTTQCSNF